MAEGLSLEDCVETIAATLADLLGQRRGLFHLHDHAHLLNNSEAELIQYDNPHGNPYPRRQKLTIIRRLR